MEVLRTEIQGIEASTILSKFDKLEIKIDELQNTVKPEFVTKYLTRKEVAKLVGVSETTVHNWRKKGMLISYSLGNAVRYKEHEVLAAFETTKD